MTPQHILLACLGVISLYFAAEWAWSRYCLWCDTPWPYTEAILNETDETITFQPAQASALEVYETGETVGDEVEAWLRGGARG